MTLQQFCKAERDWLAISIMLTIGTILLTGALLYFTEIVDLYNVLLNLTPSQAYAQANPAKTGIQGDLSWIVGLIGGLILIGASVFQGIRWLRGTIIRELKDAIQEVKNDTKAELTQIKVITDAQTKIIEHRLNFVDQQLKDIKSSGEETRIKVDSSIEEHTEIRLTLQRHGDAISNIQKYLEEYKKRDE